MDAARRRRRTAGRPAGPAGRARGHHRARQRRGARAADGRRALPRRLPPGLGGARAAGAHGAPRRPAHRVGAHVRAHAGRRALRGALRGVGGQRRRRAAARRDGRRAARAVPPLAHRGADGRRRHALDAGLRRGEPRARQSRARDDQRGAGQGAALRRQRRDRGGAAALARHRGGTAAGSGAAPHGRDRPARPTSADAITRWRGWASSCRATTSSS